MKRHQARMRRALMTVGIAGVCRWVVLAGAFVVLFVAYGAQRR